MKRILHAVATAIMLAGCSHAQKIEPTRQVASQNPEADLISRLEERSQRIRQNNKWVGDQLDKIDSEIAPLQAQLSGIRREESPVQEKIAELSAKREKIYEMIRKDDTEFETRLSEDEFDALFPEGRLGTCQIKKGEKRNEYLITKFKKQISIVVRPETVRARIGILGKSRVLNLRMDPSKENGVDQGLFFTKYLDLNGLRLDRQQDGILAAEFRGRRTDNEIIDWNMGGFIYLANYRYLDCTY